MKGVKLLAAAFPVLAGCAKNVAYPADPGPVNRTPVVVIDGERGHAGFIKEIPSMGPAKEIEGGKLTVENTVWQLEELNGRKVEPRSETKLKVTFISPDDMIGNTGCDTITSSYALEGNNLQLSDPIAYSGENCFWNEPIETDFPDALSATRSYEVADGTLLLYGEKGDLLARFVRLAR